LEFDFIAKHSPFIELLIRDKIFYLLWMNLFSAFRSHNFCIICAYEKHGYQEHPNHEINLWQRAQAIPAMEIAIVQSTRAIETALGKPGKRENRRSFDRAIKRWKDAIDINPFDEYYIAEQSYIDYYYELFNIRGSAAHGLSSLPYDLRRKKVIQAQCFAFEIMRSYFVKNQVTEDKAVSSLKINKELLNQKY